MLHRGVIIFSFIKSFRLFIFIFILKSKKYFDSGDWNMAQSRQKSNLNSVNQSNRTMNTIAMNNATSTTTTTFPTNISVTSPSVTRDPQANADLLQTPGSDRGIASSPLSTSSNLSPVVTASNENSSHLNTTPNAVSNIDPTIKVTTTPTMYNSTTCNSQNITPLANNNLNHPLNHHYLNASNSVSPLMSSSISSNNLLNPHFNNQQQPQQQLSSSMSTQSISMLSSSISNDRLSTIQLNPTNPTCILDNEEIGHVIPTPECLPQSRKHSIVQSKLATPRLSSS
jgi:hypothetical protein